MDVITKYLNRIAYKFPKGYPDMNNDQDVLLLESEISKLIGKKFSLKEGTKVQNHTIANEKIINSPEGKKAGLVKMSNPYRIGNRNKISKEEFIEIIKSIYPNTEIEVLSKGVGENKSGKFNLFKFKTEDGDIALYLAGGGNEGEKYEQNFVGNAKQGAGQPNNTLPKNLQTLYKSLGIDSTKLSQDDIKFAGATDTKRNLSFEGPKDVGKTVSDMTINYEGKEYYISLKNKSGSGVYSGKNVPFIVNDNGTIVYDASKREAIPNISTLYDMFKIDPEKVAQGLNDYISKDGREDSWSSIDIEETKFQNLLASSFGYGLLLCKRN